MNRSSAARSHHPLFARYPLDNMVAVDGAMVLIGGRADAAAAAVVV
jgi:hypothetical protein